MTIFRPVHVAADAWGGAPEHRWWSFPKHPFLPLRQPLPLPACPLGRHVLTSPPMIPVCCSHSPKPGPGHLAWGLAGPHPEWSSGPRAADTPAVLTLAPGQAGWTRGGEGVRKAFPGQHPEVRGRPPTREESSLSCGSRLGLTCSWPHRSPRGDEDGVKVDRGGGGDSGPEGGKAPGRVSAW